MPLWLKNHFWLIFLHLDEKKLLVKIHSMIIVVFFWLPDLDMNLATFPKEMFFQYIISKMINLTYLYHILTLLEQFGSFFNLVSSHIQKSRSGLEFAHLDQSQSMGYFSHPTFVDLIFDAKFEYSMSPGNFQNFSGKNNYDHLINFYKYFFWSNQKHAS